MARCPIPAKGEVIRADIDGFQKAAYRVHEVEWTYGDGFADIILVLIRLQEPQNQDGLPGANAEDRA